MTTATTHTYKTIDPSKLEKRDAYFLSVSLLVPRPIAWVSTLSKDGVRNLAPFSWFNAISANPPLVYFAPGRSPDGSKKDTLCNVEETGEFVVNIVTEELAEAMNETAIDFPRDVDEFDAAGLSAAPCEVVSPPRVAESPVSFECKRYDVVHIGPDGAGGAMVIGEIVRFHIDERVLNDGRVDVDLLRPIGRMGGMDYTRTRDHFEILRKKFRPE